MDADSWIVESLGLEKVLGATTEATRRRLKKALRINILEQVEDEQLKFTASALELSVYDLMYGGDPEQLCKAAVEAFQVARVLPRSESAIEAAEMLLRIGCFGVLGERTADVKRLLTEDGIPELPLDSADWGTRVWSTILDIWLRLLRKKDWSDLDLVQQQVAGLRSEQVHREPQFLILQRILSCQGVIPQVAADMGPAGGQVVAFPINEKVQSLVEGRQAAG